MSVMIRWSPDKPYVPYLFDNETGEFLPVPWVFGLMQGKKKNKPRKGAWIRDVVFGGEVYQFKLYKERQKKKENEEQAKPEGEGSAEGEAKSAPEAKPEPATWTIRMMGRYQHSIGDPRERRVAVFRSVDMETWGVQLFKPTPVVKGEIQVPKWAYPVAGRISVAQLVHCEKISGEQHTATLTPAIVGSSDGVDFDVFLPLFEKNVFGGELKASTMQGKQKKLKIGDEEYTLTRYYEGGENRTHHLTVEGTVHLSVFPLLFDRDNLPRKLVDANSKDGYLWYPIVKRAEVATSDGAKFSEDEVTVVEESHTDDSAQPDEVLVPVEG